MENISFKTIPKDTLQAFKRLSTINHIGKFTLIGGTAIAMHLRHRHSFDLDFVVKRDYLSRKLLKDIDIFVTSLKNAGFTIKRIEKDNEQCDIILHNTKITFFSDISFPVKNRKKFKKYNNIYIADIDTLFANKFHTILKHRVKSRDFFDLYYALSEKYYESLKNVVAVYMDLYGKYTYTADIEYIKRRFLQEKLSRDDEGIDFLENGITFDRIREYFFQHITELVNEDEELFTEAVTSRDEYFFKNFTSLDMKNMSLKLLQENRFEEFKYFLSTENAQNILNLLSKKDLSQNSSFQEIINKNTELFDFVLKKIDCIPENLKYNNNQEIIDIVNKHRIINRVKKIMEHNPEKLDIFFKNKNIPNDVKQIYIKMALDKTKNRPVKKKKCNSIKP